MTAADDLEFAELMSPLLGRIVAEMKKERGAELLTDAFLGALAARAAVAAGAYMGDPRSIVRSVERRTCPGCGTGYRRGADGWSCVHTAACDWSGSGP